MTTVNLPQLGESVVEGTITRHLVPTGSPVSLDQPLFEVSTDKVDTEVPSPVAGVVSRWLVAEGETVPVGTAIVEVSTDATESAPTAQPTPGPESLPAPAQPQEPAQPSSEPRIHDAPQAQPVSDPQPQPQPQAQAQPQPPAAAPARALDPAPAQPPAAPLVRTVDPAPVQPPAAPPARTVDPAPITAGGTPERPDTLSRSADTRVGPGHVIRLCVTAPPLEPDPLGFVAFATLRAAERCGMRDPSIAVGTHRSGHEVFVAIHGASQWRLGHLGNEIRRVLAIEPTPRELLATDLAVSYGPVEHAVLATPIHVHVTHPSPAPVVVDGGLAVRHVSVVTVASSGPVADLPRFAVELESALQQRHTHS